MKKLLLGVLLLLCTFNTFSQINFSIEGKWRMPGFDNTLYIFENGERFTYYCTAGNCDSLYNTFESGDGNHIPGIEEYTVTNDTITLDYNFGNILVSHIVFSCEGNIVTFVDQNNLNYVRLGTNINDCNTPLGVLDINKGIDVSYFPNPSSDFVNFAAINTIEKIALYNVLGEEVLSKEVNAQNFKMDVSLLTPGSYFAKLDSNRQSKIIKLIKF
jgi:hypothetical protein